MWDGMDPKQCKSWEQVLTGVPGTEAQRGSVKEQDPLLKCWMLLTKQRSSLRQGNT